MSIRKVEVVAGCISCRTCESVCPEIFKVDPTSKVINHDYLRHAKAIFKARKLCPVQVIKVEGDDAEEGLAELDSATVSKIEYLTPDTVELTMSADGFAFEPGQYASVSFEDANGKFTRSYSIVEGNAKSFTLAVKLLPGGRWAAAIAKLAVGAKVEYAWGLGHFTLKKTDAPKVFIATGTGLAPMIAMLEATPENVRKTVIFGVRHDADVFYAERLRKYPNTQTVITVSKPSDAWVGKTWRVTDYLDLVTPESEAYACGNPDMVESVMSALRAAGHPPELTFHESFVSQAAVEPKEKGFRAALSRFFIDGDVPWIEAVQRLLIAASVAVPFVWWLFPEYENFLWSVSWISVVTLMCVRPLGDIFPNVLFFKSVLPLRKWLGILSSSIVVTGLAFTLAAASSKKIVSTYFSAKWWGIASYSAFARISEITAVLLLVTSNSFSQKLLWANWKRIQRLSYAYFYSAGILLYYYGQTSVAYGMGAVTALWLGAEIRKKFFRG